MEGKSDVKAMMARFQDGATSNDETSPAGRTKQPLQPTLSSGPAIMTKKPVLENLSGSVRNTPPKPAFHKNVVSIKNDAVVPELNKTKALASRFGNTLDDTNTSIKPLIGNKQQIPMKPHPSKPPEAKGPLQKTPLNKCPLSSTLSDSKPNTPPAHPPKPSWLKEDSGGGAPSTSTSPPKVLSLQQKPSSSLIKLWQQNEEKTGANKDAAIKPSHQINSTFKPPSNLRIAQFNKEKDNNEQPELGGTSKPALFASNSACPPKPPASKKPSLKWPNKDSLPPVTVNSDATSGPKRNSLPNELALGAAPAKPNRPPRVNLEKFKRGAEEGPGTFGKAITPSPQSSHPSNHSNHVNPPLPPQDEVPSLPPRHPGMHPGIEQEEVYDDIEEVNNAPPPLPPPSGHPSQWVKEEFDDDDGDMYDDLDERWEEAEQKLEKKKEKEAKEQKKRLEAEKKEQKERDKKEQDARKKFKLVGPLEVIHRGKACVECKGSKTDLGLKLGDSLDILRVQGNPEGKWLGRTQDGSIGYVKTTSVEIDFNTLKKCQSQHEPEVYDDIDVSSDNSGTKGPGVVLPPPPGEDGEIYDDVVDPMLQVSPVVTRSHFTKPHSFLRMFERNNRPASTKVVPPPSQFTTKGNSDDDEIYDDVDPQSLPPPLPVSSLPALKGRGRTEETDPKKQKKFDKEEKDFRKKFKYDGDIQVLHQVTIVHTLTNKKWSGKELPVKAGETLDVIVEAVDNKYICRNEEGKFGYVSTSHVVMDDADIYDDIGDDCVYDND